MRYRSKFIALTLSALTTACVAGHGSGPGSGSGSGSGPGPRSDAGMPSVSEALCDRLGSCNFLVGSLDDCVQKANREFSVLTPNERADLETLLRTCIALRSCDSFVACIGSFGDETAAAVDPALGVSGVAAPDR